MTRNELIKSREYWMAQISLNLFELIEDYRKKNNLNKTQLAAQLGVTKSYVTQILNGDFDHKVSKLVDISLAFGKVPVLKFIDAGKYIEKNTPTSDISSVKKSGLSHPKKALSKINRGTKRNGYRKVVSAEI